MNLQLPHPIEIYVRAENAGDVEALADCFAPYATVRDEGHFYEGVPAIRDWKARTKRKRNYTVIPLEISSLDGSATLTARLAGNFRGSPMIANFHFALVKGQIASLQIRN